MSTDKEKVEDIPVTEEKDGSATVELPDELVTEDSSDEPEVQVAQDDGDADQPGDTDAVREARRNRRKAKKEYIKRTNEEKDQRLVLLQRENEEFRKRLAEVEKKSQSFELARLDKAIQDEELRLKYFDAKRREAINNSNGDAYSQANKGYEEALRKFESMQALKDRAAKTQEEPQADPKMLRHAKNWMESNSWYDPNGSDEDSEIAKIIDAKLAKEGYDPASADYWEELDARLQKRLPHRYTQPQDEPKRRPRSFVTGSGRESTGGRQGNTLVLEPEMVRAMKEAGFWDDPAKRAKMIKRYAQEARNNRG
jgi:hypothetical protein